MLALGAQTGPVFLTYRASDGDRSHRRARSTAGAPIIDFTAPDGVRHTLWRVGGADRDALVAAFGRIPALYIADGHHRAASAARARAEMRDASCRAPRSATAPMRRRCWRWRSRTTRCRSLPYNRTVKDLGGLSPDAFLAAVRERVRRRRRARRRRRSAATSRCTSSGAWHTLRPRVAPDPTDPIGSLDVSVLQERLLAPMLKIADVRTDKRIDFVGGARGTSALEQLVDSGKAAVAFSLYPGRASPI